MRVNGSGQGTAEKAKGSREADSTRAVGETKTNKKKSVRSDVETGVSDKVSISGKAKDASLAKEVARNAADVNEEKVARLKEQIRSGAYKVDADRVADRLVDEHLASAF
jgi:negative regulator of flagellin synthesis FlgM